MNRILWELVLIDDKGREVARALHLHSKEQAEDFATSWNSQCERHLQSKERLRGRWQISPIGKEDAG